MVALSGLADRSFKRRFARATGVGPLEYVHTLRLEESKQVLETTELPIEAVPAAVAEFGWTVICTFNGLALLLALGLLVSNAFRAGDAPAGT
jgi:transcriptional regulator GlxA family with amidase domain